MTRPRTLDEIRSTIEAMPFAKAMRLEVASIDGGIGVVAMPLHRDVSFDGRAFAGVAVATVADVAAGAALFAVIEHDQMPVTIRVDSSITASTRGDRLWAESQLRDRDGDTFIFDSTVRVERSGVDYTCGHAVVTLRVL